MDERRPMSNDRITDAHHSAEPRRPRPVSVRRRRCDGRRLGVARRRGDLGARARRDARQGSGARTRRAPLILAAFLLAPPLAGAAETYRGIAVAPEHRCAPYDRADYRYSQSVEPRIVASLGKVYGPYTGTCFGSMRETDIEHMVAVSEAHDSGLCAASASVRAAFASDLLNLTLAAPGVNRHQKSARDVAEWTPPLNACWFVDRTLEVRRKYELTIDPAEAAAAERILSRCDSTVMVVACNAPAAGPAAPTHAAPAGTPGDVDALALWDDNRNGRITCAEARRHGIAPVPRSHPAYRYMRDGDGDGVVCE